MIFSFRKALERFKFVFLFVILTFALYHFIHIVTSWLEPPMRYKEPSGHSVKVFHQKHVSWLDDEPIGERLKLFYWTGE